MDSDLKDFHLPFVKCFTPSSPTWQYTIYENRQIPN